MSYGKVESGVTKVRGRRGWRAWARRTPHGRLEGKTRRFKFLAKRDAKKLARTYS